MTRLYAVVVLLLAFGGCWLCGHHAGEAAVQARWDAARVSQAVAAQVQLDHQQMVTTQVVTQYVPQIHIVRVQGAAIVQQVPVYVPSSLDPLFPLSVGFVRLHDAAATGVPLSGSPSPLDATRSTVTASAAARVIASNYGECRVTAQRLTALQAWVRGMTSEY